MAYCRCSIISRVLRWILPLLVLAGSSGCTDLFFVPLRQQVYTPEQLGIRPVDVQLQAADGTRLFAWQLPAENPRGVICFFHGNAENISTHVINVAWLPAEGYEVLAVDYRGYGASAGTAEFPEVMQDVRAGLDWCLDRGRELGRPVWALGQSLGAALVLETVAQAPYREQLAGVVADSGFSGYRRIVRDALSHGWLTWPFRYPLSLLVTGSHDPEVAVRDLAPLPLLVLHSPQDSVVPYAHGERVFAAANSPKCFLRTGGPHIAALRAPEFRDTLLVFLADTGAGAPLRCPAL